MANIKGTAKWAKLGIPKDNYDEYQGNGNKNYIIDLYVSNEDLVKFKSDISAAYASIGENEKFFKNGKPQEYPKEPMYTPLRTDADGKEFLRFTTKAFDDEGNQKVFPLFGANGKPLEKQVGNGSEIQLNYAMSGIRNSKANAGVKAYMNAIQVDKLVERGGNTADSYGFDKPSDSYGFSGNEEIPI